MTDLSAFDEVDAELGELVASVPLVAVDEQPAAPVVAEVEQGELDLSDVPWLQARNRAIERVVAHDRREAQLFAARADDLVQVHRLTEAAEGRSWAAPSRSLPLELGGARRLGQLKVMSDVASALRLTEVLPLTLAGLRAGGLNVGQSQAVLESTRHCTGPVAAEVERRLWDDPSAGRLGPSRLRERLGRLVLLVEAELDPQAQAAREACAVEGRRVSTFARPDAMAGMFVEWTAVQGLSHAAALDRLCRMVKTQDLADGITRTAAQRRVDVLAALPVWVAWLLTERDRTGAPGAAPQDLPAPGADAADEGDPEPHNDELPFPGADDGEQADHPADTPANADNPDGADSRDVRVPDALDDPEGLSGPDQPGEPGGGPPRGGPRGPEPDTPSPPGAGDASPPPITLPTSAGPPGVTMNVHIPLATALGQSQAPAYLERHGWISAAQARRMMPHARLRPVHVDEHGQPVQTESPDRAVNRAWRPATPQGDQRAVRELLLDWAHRTRTTPPHVIGTPEAQYEPSAALTRHLRIRDMRCTGPGCSQPAHRCQLDHLNPYSQGGPTVAWNFGAKSERCHNAKTHGGWQSTRYPDGSTTWTSPLGRRYWTPAFWPAPPPEDPHAPLPDPDDPAPLGLVVLTGSWPDGAQDDAPGLRHDLEDARQQAEQPKPPAPKPSSNPYAYKGVNLIKSDTPPPF